MSVGIMDKSEVSAPDGCSEVSVPDGCFCIGHCMLSGTQECGMPAPTARRHVPRQPSLYETIVLVLEIAGSRYHAAWADESAYEVGMARKIRDLYELYRGRPYGLDFSSADRRARSEVIGEMLDRRDE